MLGSLQTVPAFDKQIMKEIYIFIICIFSLILENLADIPYKNEQKEIKCCSISQQKDSFVFMTL